jgi:NAD(P)-dependent dehydrogenase (short-subunit alcohol dehydrogenase family)
VCQHLARIEHRQGQFCAGGHHQQRFLAKRHPFAAAPIRQDRRRGEQRLPAQCAVRPPFEDVEYSDFCENLGLNLGGLFLTSQQFAKHFQKQGHGNIINIASVYGVIAPKFEIYANTTMTMPVEYAAIKSGVIHLTAYMAKLFKGQQIRVNCISPGGILDQQPRSFLDAYKANSLNKGMLDASDLTGTLVFLLSDNSQYINGQNIVVDDGFVL